MTSQSEKKTRESVSFNEDSKTDQNDQNKCC